MVLFLSSITISLIYDYHNLITTLDQIPQKQTFQFYRT